MISSVSLRPTPLLFSPISQKPLGSRPLQVALATIFFSSLIQTVEANPSSFMDCVQSCMKETSFFARALGCAALCSPLLLLK